MGASGSTGKPPQIMVEITAVLIEWEPTHGYDKVLVG